MTRGSGFEPGWPSWVNGYAQRPLSRKVKDSQACEILRTALFPRSTAPVTLRIRRRALPFECVRKCVNRCRPSSAVTGFGP